MTKQIFSPDELLGICQKEENEAEKVYNLSIDSILPKKNGKRTSCDDELWELSHSIKTYGIVQPVIVKSLGMGVYELLAGERRINAARLAGLKSVPALVYQNDEKDNSLVLMAVLENVQRVNLSLVDEARIYDEIINKFEIDVNKLSKKLGKSPYEIESKIEILKLPDDVLKQIDEYKLSLFHARSFLKIKDTAILKSAVNTVCIRQFDEKRTESYVDELLRKSEISNSGCGVKDVKILTNTLKQIVEILAKTEGAGKVSISDLGDATEFKIILPGA